MRPRPLLAASVILLAACRSAAEPGDRAICTGHVAAGIDVEVVDARSGAYVARGAAGTVRDGAFSDALGPARGRGVPPADTLISLHGAFERPGTYTVLVARDGYQAWHRAGVLVTRGECHVNTVYLIARLEPAL